MTARPTPAAYTFGDSAVAARRLELLAQAFADSSREFLTACGAGGSRLAVDLGCGPGCSTRLLAEVVGCERVVGLDISEAFLEQARQQSTEQISFRVHDFTSVPLPVGPCDLLYARFELSHVREPTQLIHAWATQLSTGGLLLLEETEWIETSQPAFARYLRIVDSMLADQGARLYVGSDLSRIAATDTLKLRMSRLCRPTVSNQMAATLFHLNIQTWKHQRFIREQFSPVMIGELEEELERLARAAPPQPVIQWGLRQLAFERL
jgi:trans-aconitate 2-methyltransferase